MVQEKRMVKEKCGLDWQTDYKKAWTKVSVKLIVNVKHVFLMLPKNGMYEASQNFWI
jgi:hypothetical protein